MESPSVVVPSTIGLLIADSNHMRRQLLAGAFRRRPEFRVTTCAMDSAGILAAAGPSIDVALLNPGRDMVPVRGLHLAFPDVATILLIEAPDHDFVVNAFRSGARGLFCLSESPFRLLCRCILCVHQGQIWANNEQVECLIDAVSQVPSLRVVNSRGMNLLTPREEQVVALVADGMTNRVVARELGLSEHTIKKYMFRIFDKIGVSTRVELVLYAVTRGATRQAEWIPA